MAHKSVFLWRLASSFRPWCLLQNDLYRSKNSKRQSCLTAHGRWKLLRHFSSQQLMLAPNLRQKMHFYGISFFLARNESNQNIMIKANNKLIRWKMITSQKMLPFWMPFSFLWVCQSVKNHRHRLRLFRSAVNLSLTAKKRPIFFG